MAENLQKKANIVFYQGLFIGVGFFISLLFLAINLYPKLAAIVKFLLVRMEAICGCAHHLSFTNHPFIFTFVILSGLGIAGFCGLAIIKTLRLKRATSKFVKANLKNSKPELSRKLKNIAQSLDIERKLIEINGKAPIIFCFGFFRPKICISSELAERLSQKELGAVLLHEKYHLQAKEPIKLFLMKLIAKILFFIPAFKILLKKYLIFSEMAADNWASNNFKDKAPLVMALDKIIQLKERFTVRDNVAVSFFSITDERVNRLINNSYMPKFPKAAFKALISILIIFSLFAGIAIGLIYSGKPAIAGYSQSACLMDEAKIESGCQMFSEESVCLMMSSAECAN